MGGPATDGLEDARIGAIPVSTLSRYEGLLGDVGALYGIHFLSYVLPLITVPYLARVLGAAGWGVVAFTQGFGGYVAAIVEYGFDLSASRQAARYRGDVGKLGRLVAGVVGARLMLGTVAVSGALVLRRWVPAFVEHSEFFWAGLFWAVGPVVSMAWYFQGTQRLRLLASIELVTRCLATAAVFTLVRRPGDGWLVLAINGAAAWTSGLGGFVVGCRGLPVGRLSLLASWRTLRMGWSLFLYRCSVSLYTVGNPFLLGLFVPPAVIGHYAGGEKISKAILGLLGPVSQAFYPRVSWLATRARREAARAACASLAIMGGGGILACIATLGVAGWLVPIALGPGFEGAISVLRVLALMVPAVALSNVLGIQWMLPLGLDRAVNVIIILAGLLNVLLAVILAPRFGALGMAGSVVTTEIFVTSAMFGFLRCRAADPISCAYAPAEVLEASGQ